jgi:Ca2+-binding EF-hand superfamily protein
MEPEMRLRLVRLLGVTAICLGALAAPAQASSEWIISRMGNVVRADVTWEQVRSQMLVAFYQSNPGERGVSPQGVDDLRRVAVAQRRSQVIAQILDYDLDGDGSVTKDEIIAAMQPRARQMIQANGVQLEPTPQQVRLQLDKLVSDALKPDTDGDGVITAAEIQQEAQKQADQAGLGWQQNATQLVPMTLDADGDGAVSLAEYEAAVREQFDAIDQDRDGRVSAGELADFGKRLNEARQAEHHASAAQAQTLRFEAAEMPMKDDGGQEMAALLPGRAADEIGGEPSAATFGVPAARHFPDLPAGNAIEPSKEARDAIDAPKEGRGEMLSREVQEDHAAGIAQIDAEPVISAQPVKPDTVRPGRADLAELVDAGPLAPE